MNHRIKEVLDVKLLIQLFVLPALTLLGGYVIFRTTVLGHLGAEELHLSDQENRSFAVQAEQIKEQRAMIDGLYKIVKENVGTIHSNEVGLGIVQADLPWIKQKLTVLDTKIDRLLQGGSP